ncbi:unnamed protein product [Chrysoparadoxa australica]
MVAKGSWKAHAGGAPCNVACALSKLGCEVAFAGAVGDDKEGHDLLALLEEHGVKTTLTKALKGEQTRTVMVTRDMSGERTFAGFGEGKSSTSFADCQYSLDGLDTESLKGVNWLVQGTIGMSHGPAAESHEQLSDLVKSKGGKVLIDVNYRPVFWEHLKDDVGEQWEQKAREIILKACHRADALKMTDEEAEFLSNGAITAEKAFGEPSLVLQLFPAAKAVLITSGSKGASYDIMGIMGHVQGFDVECVESTGAGDAFTAGFLYEMEKYVSFDMDLEELILTQSQVQECSDAVTFAAAMGALTVTKHGAIAGQPMLQEVKDLLANAAVESGKI